MTMTARRVRVMMRREDYKAVKHMDKTQMEKYLQTVYQLSLIHISLEIKSLG